MYETSELLESGDLLPIATVAHDFTGTRPSRPTIWRWVNKGVNGGIKLPAVPIYGSWQTTRAAFKDFLTRRAQAALQPRETAPPASDDDLRAAGLL